MEDPTAEVIMSVEIRVKVTDTGINEGKELILNEYVQVEAFKWTETFKHTASRVSKEMLSLVEAMEVERFKAQ